MQITKQTAIQIVIGLYILLSLGYIAFTKWTNFKTQYSERAFQSGQADAIAQLIQQTNNSDCQPFAVYNEQAKVQLINLTCVQQTTTEETNETN